MNDSMILRVVQFKEQLIKTADQIQNMSDLEKSLRIALLQVEVNDLRMANLKEGLQIMKKASEYVDAGNEEGIAVCHKMFLNNQEAEKCFQGLQGYLDYFKETGSLVMDTNQLN